MSANRPTYPRLSKGPPEQLRMLPRRTRIPPLEQCSGQFTVYQFIVDYKRLNDGNSPSLSVIADGCAMSETVVRTHISKLMLRKAPDGKPLVWRNNKDQLEIGGVYQPPEVE